MQKYDPKAAALAVAEHLVAHAYARRQATDRQLTDASLLLTSLGRDAEADGLRSEVFDRRASKKTRTACKA